MSRQQAFCEGYEKVKASEITSELSIKEIREKYNYSFDEEVAFSNGIIDAIHNDSWRYERLIK